ncbi:DUF2637 domain-containing protein [Streptomyces phaeochromogenes]|nr:DUF2637 domain-containing protein [Streptomyces phaeochromogenes]
MGDAAGPEDGAVRSGGFELDALIRHLCALVVAGVAAYASYVHQREFALQGGADAVSSALRPLSVDGLLLLATVGLLKPSQFRTCRARGAIWAAFPLGIAVSLAANIAAAPAWERRPVLVEGRPPVPLLLSVELLAHRTSCESAPSWPCPHVQATSSPRGGRPPVPDVMQAGSPRIG